MLHLAPEFWRADTGGRVERIEYERGVLQQRLTLFDLVHLSARDTQGCRQMSGARSLHLKLRAAGRV